MKVQYAAYLRNYENSIIIKPRPSSKHKDQHLNIILINLRFVVLKMFS